MSLTPKFMKPTLADSINNLIAPASVKDRVRQIHLALGRKLSCEETNALDFVWDETKEGGRYWANVYSSDLESRQKHNFISYLEGTLIPDLMKDGMEFMAEDFKTCIQYMR